MHSYNDIFLDKGESQDENINDFFEGNLVPVNNIHLDMNNKNVDHGDDKYLTQDQMFPDQVEYKCFNDLFEGGPVQENNQNLGVNNHLNSINTSFNDFYSNNDVNLTDQPPTLKQKTKKRRKSDDGKRTQQKKPKKNIDHGGDKYLIQNQPLNNFGLFNNQNFILPYYIDSYKNPKEKIVINLVDDDKNETHDITPYITPSVSQINSFPKITLKSLRNQKDELVKYLLLPVPPLTEEKIKKALFQATSERSFEKMLNEFDLLDLNNGIEQKSVERFLILILNNFENFFDKKKCLDRIVEAKKYKAKA